MGCTVGDILRAAVRSLLHPSLFPFYGLNVLYGVSQYMGLEEQFGKASSVLFKAAPIWYLAILTKLLKSPQTRADEHQNQNQQQTGFREGQLNSQQQQNGGTGNHNRTIEEVEEEETRWATYKSYFLYGLLLSSAGDAFLVFDSAFLHGVFMFGIAHVFYILGLRHRFKQCRRCSSRSFYAWLLFPVGLLMSPYLLTGIDSHVLGAAVVIYNLIINTMLFQAVSSLENHVCDTSAFLAAIGAFSFVVSDSMLAIHAWKITLPYPTLMIMSTYYFAQVCMALSVY